MEIHIIQGSTHALACLTPAKFINIYVADCVRFALNFTGHYAKVCINCKLGWVGVKIRFIYIYIYRYEYEFSIYIYMYYRKWRYIFEMLICKPHLKLSFIKTWCYSHERNVKLHSISLFSTWNATYLPLQNPKTKRTQKAFLLRAVLICTERPIFVMVVCNIFTCLKICPHTSPRPLWMISRLYIFVELNVIHQKLCSISPVRMETIYIYIFPNSHYMHIQRHKFKSTVNISCVKLICKRYNYTQFMVIFERNQNQRIRTRIVYCPLHKRLGSVL